MMTGALDTTRVYSREDYRRWCEQQPRGRYERVDGEIVAMAPERGGHLRMKIAIYKVLERALAIARVDCQPLPDGATIETGDNDFEPDAVVNCGQPIADDAIAVPNPIVVIEILSPGSAVVDTGAKLDGYFRVPSIAHYLIVHPTRRSVIHHRRDGDVIATRVVTDGAIDLDPPGIRLQIDDIYGGL